MKKRPLNKDYLVLSALRVLDPACGAGGTTKEFADRWIQATGSSLSTFYAKLRNLKKNDLICSSTNENHELTWDLSQKGKKLLETGLFICSPPYSREITDLEKNKASYFKKHADLIKELIDTIAHSLEEKGQSIIQLDLSKLNLSIHERKIIRNALLEAEKTNMPLKTIYQMNAKQAKNIQEKLKELI